MANIYSNYQDADFGGVSVHQEGRQSLKLSRKTTVFKRVNFLIRGPSMSIGGPDPLAPLIAGSAKILVFVQDGLGEGPWLPCRPPGYAYS